MRNIIDFDALTALVGYSAAMHSGQSVVFERRRECGDGTIVLATVHVGNDGEGYWNVVEAVPGESKILAWGTTEGTTLAEAIKTANRAFGLSG